VHPAPNAVLSLATDASDTHFGGVLQQLNGGSWQPLAFYSKKLSGVGTRYSTFDRELLAAFSAVRHFRFLLEGRQFRLLINHKPLVTSLFRRLITTRFLAANGKCHNHYGQGLPALPSKQVTNTYTYSQQRYRYPTAVHPHPRQPGRAATSLARPHLSVHNHRLNLKMAGSHPTNIHHHR
jgi:hypothetical protein